MKINFIGACHEVTGSMTLLEAAGLKILVDCGMEQGRDIYENSVLPIAPGELDCILLTHAHIDHSGRLPVMTANGYNGPIYSTGATAKLCNIMLMDSAHIQESDAEWKNRKAKRSGKELYVPMYTLEDAQHCLSQFKPCEYNEVITVSDSVSVRFLDAGHLLGSASIEITVTENGETKVVLFSGDVGNIDRPLIRDPQKPEKADYVIVESTYGDRIHGERPDYVSQLVRILQETFDKGGNVVIPSFAVGRTQELLYLIREIKEQKLISGHDRFPVFVDSPLAVEATSIYSGDLNNYYDEETLKLLALGIEPIKFQDLRVSITSDESKAINEDKEPKVILSASGMCDAGRIRHHLKHNLWRKDSTILFVGYQTEGTLGRILLDGTDRVKLFGEEVIVNATIEQMDGISGHADRDMLLGWVGNISPRPKTVFVNHGQDTVTDVFADKIKESFGIQAIAPYSGSRYELGEMPVCLEKGNMTRLEKSVQTDKKTNSVLERLRNAGRRLCAVIERNKECSNKDLAKFADQVTQLCDKWDR